MKVKCKKIISPGNGEDLGESSLWLTVGKEYVVLGLKIKPRWGVQIFLLDDSYHEPMLSDLLGFEVTSQDIPEHWKFHIDEYGVLYIIPESWMHDGFFDQIDDGEEEALKVFYNEAKLAYKKEGYILDFPGLIE